MSENIPESCEERELILLRYLKPGPGDRVVCKIFQKCEHIHIVGVAQ